MEVRVELSRVIIRENSDEQMIVLREKGGDRSFPIIIGIFEAVAIDRKLKDIKVPRPLTHDLLVGVIEAMGGKLTRVVVNDLRVNNVREGTFYGRLHIERDGKDIEVDARPSDSIALAVRVGCPIYAEESVLKDAGP